MGITASFPYYRAYVFYISYVRSIAELTHSLLMKLLQPHHQQQDVDCRQCADDDERIDVVGIGESAAQPFTGIDQRIDQHRVLQYRESFQKAPGIVGAP